MKKYMVSNENCNVRCCSKQNPKQKKRRLGEISFGGGRILNRIQFLAECRDDVSDLCADTHDINC